MSTEIEKSINNKMALLSQRITECAIGLSYLESIIEDQEYFIEETVVRIEDTFCAWENELLTEVEVVHGAHTFLHGDILADFNELSRERVTFLDATLNDFFLVENESVSSFAIELEKRELVERTIHEKHDLLIEQAEKLIRGIDALIEEDKLLWEKVIKTKDAHYTEAESSLKAEYEALNVEAHKLQKESEFYTPEISIKFQRLASLGRRLSRLSKNKEDSDTQLTRMMELKELLKEASKLEE